MAGTESDKPLSVDYQLTILRMMANQLPETTATLFNDQIDKLCKALIAELSDSQEAWRKIRNALAKELSDIGTDVKYMQFDLEATRRERDEYKKRYG
jgi:hypothetical protein